VAETDPRLRLREKRCTRKRTGTRRPGAFGAYNIGTGVETSVNRLYEQLLEISARDLPPQHGPSMPGEQLRSCVDPTLAGRTFDWHPQTDIHAGL
jgi:UDP-glucose 4-epimerase